MTRQLPTRIGRRLGRATRAFRARARFGVGVDPLSNLWGFDRGVPVARYYLGGFLREFAPDIRGHCLEFQEDAFASELGGRRVAELDILHLDASNPAATIVADLTKANEIPSNTFDCIICTHVLHVVYELEAIVSELARILAPRGALLIGVPGVSMSGSVPQEFWRFTPDGLSRLLQRSFSPDDVTVRGYGNSLTAAGELRGLVAGDFAPRELESHDPRFAVEVCGRAVKAADPDDARG